MKRGILYKRERYNLYLFHKEYKKKINIKKMPIISFNEHKNIIKKIKAIKLIYGIRQKQFRQYVKKLKINDYSNLDKLLLFLEKRLDVILYRSGTFNTRLNSRKQIVHKNIKVNDNIVNKPSFIIKVNDFISFKKNIIFKNKNNKYFEYIDNKIKILKILKVNEEKILSKI